MCGIVAMLASYNNGFTFKETKAFTDMLFVDTLRGWDSTGVFYVSNSGDVELYKGAVSAPDFIKTTEYKRFSDSIFSDGMFVVGHNRAATRGIVEDKNAHPFVINDNIVLVQNGTWNGSHSHIKDTEVDTEALAHIIDEHPDDVESALQKINAAYALVWYNVKNKTLNAIRNNERPLHIVRTVDNGTWLASEAATLLFVAHRNDVKIKGLPEMLEPGHLYTWKLTEQGTYEETVDKVDHEYKGVAGNAGPFRQGYYHQYSGFGGEYSHDWDKYDKSNWKVSEVGVDVTITTRIERGEFKDWEIDNETANSYSTLMSERKSHVHYIEFVDYVAGNNHKECKAWYLVGTIINADAISEPGPLVYSLVTGVDEQEVIKMVTETPFWKVTIPSFYKQFITKAGKYIVTGFATTKESYEASTENTVQ